MSYKYGFAFKVDSFENFKRVCPSPADEGNWYFAFRLTGVDRDTWERFYGEWMLPFSDPRRKYDEREHEAELLEKALNDKYVRGE